MLDDQSNTVPSSSDGADTILMVEMEAEPPSRRARAPGRSSSLPEIPDAIRAPDALTSLLEGDDELNSQVPAEALGLRTAFVAYCRGPDWRPQPPSGSTNTTLSSNISNSGGTINGGAVASISSSGCGGLYASPSTQNIGSSSPADGGGELGMGLSNWMKLWTDMGLQEGQGGPVPGTVLQTMHAAYRPHNSAKLNYLGFVQACAALSCQTQQSLLGAVGRHGAALQEQQRNQWRLQKTQQQVAQAARSNRPARSSWTAGDEDVLFESNLDLTPHDIAKEISVLSQLQVQLSELQQQNEAPDTASGSAAPPPTAAPPKLGFWKPHEPFPLSLASPRYFPEDLVTIRSQASVSSGAHASGRGGVGGGNVRLPYATGATPFSGDSSPPALGKAGGGGSTGGGGRSPQLKGAKASSGWVRSGGGGYDNMGGIPTPPSSNPYLQGLSRSKLYAPQLRSLRNAGPGEGVDPRAYHRDNSPGRGPRTREAGTASGPTPDDPDPASSPLDGPVILRGDRGVDQDQAYPMSSGPQPIGSSTTGMMMPDRRGFVAISGRSSGAGGDAVKLPALAGVRTQDAGAGSAVTGASASMPPQVVMDSSDSGGSPMVAGSLANTYNRQLSNLRGSTSGVPGTAGTAGGGNDIPGNSGGGSGTGVASTPLIRGSVGATAGIGRGVADLDGTLTLAAMLARIERLERAAVSAESRLSHVGSRVRSLEVAEDSVSKTSNGRLLNEEAVLAAADAAADARVKQFGEELARVFEELDGRQAFFGRQTLEQHHRLMEHQHRSAEQQQRAAVELAEALSEARAAAEEAEAARKEAAAAREEAAAAMREAAAAKTAVEQLAIAAEEAKKAAADAAAAAAAAILDAQTKTEEERVRSSLIAEDKARKAAALAVAEEVDKVLSPAKAQMDEQVRQLDDKKKDLDEQVATLIAQQQQLLAELGKLAAEAKAAAETSQSGVEAANAAAAVAATAAAEAAAKLIAVADAAKPPDIDGFNIQAAELRALVEELQREMGEVRREGDDRHDQQRKALDEHLAKAEAQRQATEFGQQEELAGMHVMVSELQAAVSKLSAAAATANDDNEDNRTASSIRHPPPDADVQPADPAVSADVLTRLKLLEAEMSRASEALNIASLAEPTETATDAALGEEICGVVQTRERSDGEVAATPYTAEPQLSRALASTVARLNGRLHQLQRRLDEQSVIQSAMLAEGAPRSSAVDAQPRRLASPGTSEVSRPGSTAGDDDSGAKVCPPACRSLSDHNNGACNAPEAADPATAVTATETVIDGSGGPEINKNKINIDGVLEAAGFAAVPVAGSTSPPATSNEGRITQLTLQLEQLCIAVNMQLQQVSIVVQELRSQVDEEIRSHMESSVVNVQHEVAKTSTRIDQTRTNLRDLRTRAEDLAATVAAEVAAGGMPPAAVAAAVAAVQEATADPTFQSAAIKTSSIDAVPVAELMDTTGSRALPGGPGLAELNALMAELETLRERVESLEKGEALAIAAATHATATSDNAGSTVAAPAVEPESTSAVTSAPPATSAPPPPEEAVTAIQRRLDNLTSEVRQSLDLTSASISRDLEAARIELAVMVSKEVASQIVAAAKPSAQRPVSGRDSGAAMSTGDVSMVRALQERLTAMEEEVEDANREIADVCRAADMTTESVELLTQHLQTLEQSQQEFVKQLAEVRSQLAKDPVIGYASPGINLSETTSEEAPLAAAAAAAIDPGAAQSGMGPDQVSTIRTKSPPIVDMDVAAAVAELRAQLAQIQSQNLEARMRAAEAAVRQEGAAAGAVGSGTPSGSDGAAATAALSDPPPATPPVVPAPGSVPQELQNLMLELSDQVDDLAGLVREQENGLDVLAQLAETASGAGRDAARRLDVVEASLATLAATVRTGGGGGGSLTSDLTAASTADDSNAGRNGSPPALATRPSISVRPSATFNAQAVIEDTRATVSELEGRLGEVEKGLEVRGAAMAALSRQLDEAGRQLEALDGRVTDAAMDAAAAKAATSAVAVASSSSSAGAPTSSEASAAPGAGNAGSAKKAPVDGAYEESPDSYGSINASSLGEGANVGRLEQEWQARLKAVVKLLEDKVGSSREKAAQDHGELKREVARLRDKSMVIDEVILKLARRLDNLFKKVQDGMDAEEADAMSSHPANDRDRQAAFSNGGTLGANTIRRLTATSSRAMKREGQDYQDAEYTTRAESSALDGPSGARVSSRVNSFRGR